MKVCSFLFLFLCFYNLPAQTDSERARILFQDYKTEYGNGHFIAAKHLLEEILSYRDILPDYNVALVYNNLGLVNWQLGQYSVSRNCYESATGLLEEEDLSDKELLSLVNNNTALLHQQMGEYYLALDYYRKAEDLLGQPGLKDSVFYDSYSMIQFNKALSYYKLGEFDKAIEYNNVAADLKETYRLPYLGNVYFNLARCYEQTRDPEKADAYYRKSIRQWYTEYDSTHFELGNVFLEYARFLSDQGKESLAIEYFNKSTHNYLLNYGFSHPYTAGCYNLTGDFYLKQKEYQKALDNLQLALASITPGFNNESYTANPVDRESLMDLSLLKIYRSKIRALREYANSIPIGREKDPGAVGLLEAAAETAKDAIRVLGRIQESYITQESRLYLIENQTDFFLSGIAIALQLQEFAGKPGYQDLAYQFSAAGKAIELRFEIKQKNELYLHSLKDSAALGLLKLKEEIDGYSNMIRMEQMKLLPDSARISQWQQSRFNLRREYESIHEKLFGKEAGIDGNDWFDEDLIPVIRSKLKRSETLVEYSISDPDTAGIRNLYAFVINRKDSRVYQTVLSHSFDAQIEIVEDHLYDFSTGSLETDHLAELRGSLHRLYAELIEPIEAWFQGEDLIIIPDGELLYIPFAALMREKPQEADPYSSNSYLVRDYSISYLPVSGFLQKPELRIARKTPRLSIIAQDYSMAGGSSFSTLSGVRQEVDAIQKLMRTRLLDYDGSKDHLIREMENTRLLHFALHSYPSSEEQDASYLVLDSQSDSINNHLLFDYEVEPLNLSDDLVVLNSCETGGGEQIDGEGMMSFSRSFLLAGAKSVVQALWPVDDKSGSTIMIQFYKNLLKGRNKPVALQKAQISYLESCSPTFSHPYFWAGYQVVGETGSIATPFTRSGMVLVGISLIGLVIWLRKRHLSSEKRKAI